jgi:ABC-type transport system involved in multi-copper enzyme maturation permease subunit
MKYFAILKDSLREALDSKVLYVMMAMSTLVIIFVACISFKPLSAEKTMEQFFITGSRTPPLTVALNVHNQQKMEEHKKLQEELRNNLQALILFSLKKVDLVRGEPDAPESEYALTISYKPWPNAMIEFGGMTRPKDEAEAVRAIFREAEDYDFLHVGTVELIDKGIKEGDAKLYRVTIQGTPRMRRIWLTEPSLVGAIPLAPAPSALGLQLYFLTAIVLVFGTFAAVLVGIIITSFFIPNMLRKGTVDLLLAKPIHRWLLLVYKYIGGLAFVFFNTAFAMVGIWLVLGLRTGLWPNGSLLLVLTTTFFFAILYAIATFVGVVTRSIVTSIMVTIAAWTLCFGVGTAHGFFDQQYRLEQDAEKKGRPLPEEKQWGDNTIGRVLRVAHAIIPRTSDVEQMNDMIVYTDFMTGNLADMSKFDTSKRNWWESLLVSLVWIAIFLGLASLWFTFKDY